ncbi:MAG: ArsR family transcriptional regulator [archaeon]|nr:ArsR family transcriptional regulator [archaeon]MCP8307034.1 ArsR family transcriptional regulator [archaeon]
MERYEKLLETLGSVTRVRLLNLLMERPRCLAELSGLLGISPQAVLKHLKLLQRDGIVSSFTSDGSVGLVKNLYSLATPLHLSLGEWRGITYICAYKKEHDKEELFKVEPEMPEGKLYATFQKIDYEKYILKRRLKSIKEREMRIMQELFDLESLQKQIIKKAGYTNFEEILLYASLSEDREKEMADVAKYFRLDTNEVEKTLIKIGKKRFSDSRT